MQQESVAGSAVVLCIDGLSAAYLGPYGNTWVDTPAFNQLAAEGLLLEYPQGVSCDLSVALNGLWAGESPLSADPPNWLAGRWKQGPAWLVTDSPAVANHPGAELFDEQFFFDPPQVRRAAAVPEQTQLAQFFAQVIDLLQQIPPGGLLWIHSQAMQGAWDAPTALRHRYVGEEDPPPPEGIDPPRILLKVNDDPDISLGWSQAYAAQVSLVDLCLEAFLAAWNGSSRAENGLLAVLSPRGYPLGEHGIIGGMAPSLYQEVLHVPFFLRLPGARRAMQRVRQVFSLASIADLLLAACGVGELCTDIFFSALPPTQQYAAAACEGINALRTPAWFLLEKKLASCEMATELYHKPDDRFEVNEIARRCPQAVEEMSAVLQALKQGKQPVLSELLISGLD